MATVFTDATHTHTHKHGVGSLDSQIRQKNKKKKKKKKLKEKYAMNTVRSTANNRFIISNVQCTKRCRLHRSILYLLKLS